MFGESQVRTGHLVVGILKTRGLAHALTGISKEFQKINADTLADNFAKIVSGSPEDKLAASDGFQVGGGAAPGEASGAMASPQMGKQEALKKFAIDLTERARKGEIDPIVGRDEEIRQIVDILMRRRQNNPILTGEAGVGKTAVVEGFANRLAAGTVPPSLKDVRLLSLDIGLLQAGASMKGEFEQRLRQVIEEVQASEKPIILFVDEAHTLIGAGGAAGTGDAANLLKPALARGTLRTIAATTWAEYKKHIEKDPALTRRFQVVQVGEPSEEKAILMMRRMASVMEKHHKVQLLDEAIEAAVRLSHRYIPARQLPDKSVSLLDTACARVAISQHAVPAEVEDSRQRIEAFEPNWRSSPAKKPLASIRPHERPKPRPGSKPKARGSPSSKPVGMVNANWSKRCWNCVPNFAATWARSKAPPASWKKRPTTPPQPSRSTSRPPPPLPRRSPRRSGPGYWQNSKSCKRNSTNYKAKRRSFCPRSMNMRSVRSCKTGPASRLAGWSRTKSRRFSGLPTRSASGSSASGTPWR